MADFVLILKKELLDIFRDKRSFITLFIPILVFPLMYMLMGSQMKNNNVDTNIPCIVECGSSDLDESIYDLLIAQSTMIDDVPVKESVEEDLRGGAVACVLEIHDGNIRIRYNGNSTRWSQAVSNIYATIEATSVATAEEKLNNQYETGLEALRDFHIVGLEDINSGSNTAGTSAMASIAPMLLVMIIMSGGVSVAVDLFTGEKERGTFEALLTSQVSRMSLLMAKFSAILTISLSGMVLSILAYMVSFKFSDSARLMLSNGEDVRISALQILQLLIVCVTLSIFAVSLMTLLGLHAKTVKEAQSQMSLITIFPTLISGLTMFMDSASISTASTAIPIFNTIVCIKMIFLGTIRPEHILVTALSLLVYSGVMWLLSVRMLNSEKLLRG